MADDSTWSRTFYLSTLSFTPPAPPPPGECGTGRLVILYSTAKRRRGKPPLAARIERDRMVADVLRRQARGQIPSRAVEATAEFFRRDERTVWNALSEYYPPKEFPVVKRGEPLLVFTTVCIGPVVNTPMHTVRFVNQVDHEP